MKINKPWSPNSIEKGFSILIITSTLKFIRMLIAHGIAGHSEILQIPIWKND
jgi:hypothetical protein